MRPLSFCAVLSMVVLPPAALRAQVQAARQQTAAGTVALDPATKGSALRPTLFVCGPPRSWTLAFLL
jgi:hypothetical protein